MANLREAFEYASQNPDSDFARNLEQMASSGALNLEAKKYGIDLTPFQPKPAPLEEKPKTSIAEKVAGFTGGGILAKGLGQAIASPEIAKQQEQTQTQQMDIQGNLLTRIKEKKALGEDTSRLENALKMIGEDISKTGTETGQLLNQEGITGKQVAGDVLQLGTTLAGVGTLPGATKAVTSASTIGKGIIQGAKTGAVTGGAFGASTGASQALKEDKTLGEVATGTLKGAALGATTGAVLGGITGGVSGGLKGRALAKQVKDEQHALDLVSPKLTEQVKQQALAEGRVTEQGLLSASKIQPSKRDIQLAEAVKGVVSSKKTTLQNMEAIGAKVQDINTGVKAYVKAKKVPFNTAQLRTQLNQGKSDLDLVFASDKNAEKTYNAVVKKFIELVKNKDTSGLLDARQEFDKIPAVRKLLESDKLGENARKEIVTAVRTQANKYVASLLPKGNQYRETLLRESRMLEAFMNLKEKNTGMIGVNKLQAWTQKYPVLKGVLGTLAVGAGLRAVGVGSSVIGSSD